MNKFNLIEECNRFSRDFEVDTDSGKQKRSISATALVAQAQDFLREEYRETTEAIIKKDIEEILDGFADQAFIALNGIYKTFRSIGLAHEESTYRAEQVMKNVCDANNAKRNPDGSITLNPVGKIMKPEGWTAPNHKELHLGYTL